MNYMLYIIFSGGLTASLPMHTMPECVHELRNQMVVNGSHIEMASCQRIKNADRNSNSE